MNIKYIWINGKFIPFKKATVPILNHSLHYGSAVFEGIRCYETTNGPAVFRLIEHIKRLFHSAKSIGMKVPYTQSQIINAVKLTIKKNNLKECYIRPLIFYGEKMGLLPKVTDVNVAIATWAWPKYLKKDSVKVKISNFIRIHPKSSIMTAKISGHYENSIIASLDARNSGYDEAILLDWEKNIAEGPGENIFFVSGKTLYTPKDKSILPGITRDSVIKIARDLGYKTKKINIKPKDIKKFEEAFFVGTAVEINAIGQIGKTKIKNAKRGKVTKEIKEIYTDITHGKIKKYSKWLDIVK